MKELQDAAAVRSRVLALLERADEEPDAELRRALLTFVIGGGGFTGNGGSRGSDIPVDEGDFQTAPAGGGASDEDIPF